MISEQLLELKTVKADIKAALLEKGLAPTDKFSTYANLIRGISGDLYLDIYHTQKANNYSTTISESTFAYKYYNDDTTSSIDDGKTYNLTSSGGTFEWMFASNPKLVLFDNMISGLQATCVSMFGNCALLKACNVNTDCFTDMSSMFSGCTTLLAVKFTNVPQNVTDCTNMYYNCGALVSFPTSYPNVTKSQGMFYNCLALTNVSISIPSALNLYQMFEGCQYLQSVQLTMSSSFSGTQNLGKLFKNCNALVNAGNINFAQLFGVPTEFYTSTTPNLRKLNIYNLGYTKGDKTYATTFDFSGSNYRYWGIPNDNVYSNGARLSLVDSLITNSYDRNTNGFTGSCTISLHADTKALLTTSEIAQITAKGYTLA